MVWAKRWNTKLVWLVSESICTNRASAYVSAFGDFDTWLSLFGKALPKEKYKSSYIPDHLIAGKLLLTTYAIAKFPEIF